MAAALVDRVCAVVRAAAQALGGPDAGAPAGRQHRKLLIWSIISALAGFLFGLDAVVISGAEQKIQAIWELDSLWHGLCMSAALWGTVLGALLGGWPTERFGRRPTLIWIGMLYFVSAVGSGMAPEQNIFMVARFIGGLGIGVATVVSPLLQALARAHVAAGQGTGAAGECASAQLRGDRTVTGRPD